MSLESDIVERLKSDFDADQFSTALQLLTDSGTTGRVARCIAVAAAGSLDELSLQIGTASTDYRDAILAGEYDDIGMQQIRDLRASFLVDDPLDFWIGELAVFLNSRDFQLVSLESREATAGPFDYTCDRGEGIGTFQRADRTMIISKDNRRWQVIGDAAELQPFQLHIAYDDEDQFRSQLAWMLRRK
ncbi:hypothetical protein [Lignipirellula cremea]|nr:hypothetical protein [Lignipirellula cremea]